MLLLAANWDVARHSIASRSGQKNAPLLGANASTDLRPSILVTLSCTLLCLAETIRWGVGEACAMAHHV